MMSVLNEALEWRDRAEQAREVAGQLTDPGAQCLNQNRVGCTMRLPIS
jgi:hypothetical protein